MRMSFNRRVRTGTSHAGPHARHSHRSHNPTVAWRCEGKVVGLEPDGFTVMVLSAHGRARCWTGMKIKFLYGQAKIVDHTELGLGQLGMRDIVSVRTRLPRNLAKLPAMPAHRIDINRIGGKDHRMLYADATRSGASTLRASTRK